MTRVTLLDQQGGKVGRTQFASRCVWPNWSWYAVTNSQDVHSRGTTACGYKVRHQAKRGVTNVRARFSNTASTASRETDGFAPITVKYAILYGPWIYQATWDGGATTTKSLAINDCVDTDDIQGFSPTPGSYFWSLTYVTCATPGHWPACYDIKPLANGDGYQVDSDVTVTGTVNGTGQTAWAYGPSALHGIPTAGSPSVRAFLLDGDSIASTVDSNGDESFLAKACNQADLPYIRCATSGDSHKDFASYHAGRMALANGLVTDAIDEYATNDLRAGSSTAAQTEGYAITGWQAIRATGVIRLWQTTCVPASVDLTTQGPYEAQRVLWNTWLRDGAPIDTSNMTAAAVGATGPTISRCEVYGLTDTTSFAQPLVQAASGPAHPLKGVIELADAVETFRNSGLWTSATFGDGVHPNFQAGLTTITALIANSPAIMTATAARTSYRKLVAARAGSTLTLTKSP